MLQAIHGTPVTGHDWRATRTQRDLEARVYELEHRVATLESALTSTVDHRLPLLKSEIWGEIWMERLKLLAAVSVGIGVIAWLRVIMRWLG